MQKTMTCGLIMSILGQKEVRQQHYFNVYQIPENTVNNEPALVFIYVVNWRVLGANFFIISVNHKARLSLAACVVF